MSSKENILKAVKLIRNGELTYRKASEIYAVPKSTLFLRVNSNDPGKERIIGRKCTLTEELEENLARYVIEMSDRFYGFSAIEVRKKATELAKSNNIFVHGDMLGPKWLQGFLNRKNLVSRVSQDISIDRARGVSTTALKLYFDNLEKTLAFVKSNNRIFNVDETGISTVAKKRSKIITLKGKRRVQAIASSERGTLITLILGMSAVGQFIPPMIVYPNKKPPANVVVPAGTTYAWSNQKRGWSNTDIFSDYIDHFIKYTQPSENDPVLLIVDNHTSHIASEIMEKAKKNHIMLLTLPPHTSHYAQPLDVGFMSPFKAIFGTEEKNWMRLNIGQKVSLPNVIEFMNAAFTQSTRDVKLAENSFRFCGIVPFNRKIFDNVINTTPTTLNLNVLDTIPQFAELQISSNKRLGKSILVTSNPHLQALTTKKCIVKIKKIKFEKKLLCNNTLKLLKHYNIRCID